MWEGSCGDVWQIWLRGAGRGGGWKGGRRIGGEGSERERKWGEAGRRGRKRVKNALGKEEGRERERERKGVRKLFGNEI